MKRSNKIACVLLCCAVLTNISSFSTFAEEYCTKPTDSIGNPISPCWVYQFEHTTYMTVKSDEPLPESFYVSTPSGYLKPDGGYVIARGTVYLVGTVYDFPEAGYKQGTYKGVLTAYID